MKIGIVGWGLESQSAFRHFGPDHDYLIVNESARDDFPPQSEKLKLQYLKTQAPVGISGQVSDLSYLDGIKDCDKIVFQPTSYFNLKKAFGDDQDFWGKATTALDIFFEECPSQNIIGITGTKGKGTTSTLISKMLEADGKTVHLGGNIGTPILDLLPNIKPDDWVVWELANFQLKPATHSPHIAVVLMITEEHMDWHPDMADYVAAKANLFKHQTKDDIAIYLAGNEYSEEIAGYSPGKKIPYFSEPGSYVREDGMIVAPDGSEIIKTNELQLLGHHNWQNVCAAVTAVWQVTPNAGAMHHVLASFTGLEHRLEFVRELDYVRYYDDSFGTTPDTAIVAVEAFIQPIVLISGGSDKGISYSNLVDEIVQKDRVRHVIAIGQTGPKIAQMLRDHGFTNITEGLTTMSEIVAEARRRAQPGDVVLLSTGSASFGLFKDYKDRGNQFKSVVQALA